MNLEAVMTDGDGVYFGRNSKTQKCFIEYPHGETVLCSEPDLLNYMKLVAGNLRICKERKYFTHYQYEIDKAEDIQSLAIAEHYALEFGD